MGKLEGKRVALMVGPGFEDSEALYPYYRLQEEGAVVDVIGVGPAGTEVVGKHGVPLVLDRSVADVRSDHYQALVIPGGRGPDAIRTNPDVVRVTKEFFEAQKPVAAICHGPQILINADVLKGVTCTAYQSVAQDVKNAGARFEDRPTVIDSDHHLVTARHPGDMPQWLPAVIQVIEDLKG